MSAWLVSYNFLVVVKVVVPQPVLVGAAVPTRVQLGRVSTILSTTLRVADILKLNATVVCEPVKEAANQSEVCENAAAPPGVGPGVRPATLVPGEVAIAVAAMLMPVRGVRRAE